MHKINYKNWEIILKSSRYHGIIASSNHLISKNNKTMDGATENIKKQIDIFIEKIPKTYIELAIAIEESSYDNGYDMFNIHPKSLEILVENFINYKYESI